MKPHIKRTLKHEVKFSGQNHINKCLELADEFLDKHPEILFWTEANDSKKGLFYRYKSGVYKPCSGLEVEDMLLNFVPEKGEVIVPKNISSARFLETVTNIKRRRFFYRDVFNQENIINFKNGFFDVIDGELIPHSMDIVSTIQLPYAYDPTADCPLFRKVVNESLENDYHKIMILQEYMGYCLTSSTKYERGLFIVGASNSGKSTVVDSLKAMLGLDNCSVIGLDQLADSRFVGQILDKLANVSDEIPKNAADYEDILKRIISGQEITVNTKFVPTFSAYPTCKLIFSANDLPRINDNSTAIFRRMLLLYFNNVVPRDKVDFDLKMKIAENECPGIFNWAFEGLKRLKANNGFTSSITMDSEIEELRLINNGIYYFVREEYEVTGDSNDYMTFENLYNDYKNFCIKIGAKGIYKANIFGKELMQCFVKRIQSSRKTIGGIQVRVYTGIKKRGFAKEDEVQWED